MTVTAVQQIAAISAIANGGKLMKPMLVKEIIDPETNKVTRKIEPEVVRQVVSEQTANQVSDYLEQVVSDQKIGTGRRVYIDGYRIAGKTGTAQKVVNGKYAEDKWVVSFIGYAPADDPKIALLVIIDDPDIGGDYRRGSDVSAPVFKEIMSKSLRYFGVGKEGTSIGVTQWKDISAVTMPELTGKSVEEAKGVLNRYGLSFEQLGKGNKITNQYPRAGDQIAAEQQVYLLTEPISKLQMPDLTGRPMRDALEICSLLGADCTYAGEGYVKVQTSEPTDGVLRVQLIFDPYRPETIHNDDSSPSKEMAMSE